MCNARGCSCEALRGLATLTVDLLTLKWYCLLHRLPVHVSWRRQWARTDEVFLLVDLLADEYW